MEIICINCAYFEKCTAIKDKVCPSFLFKRRIDDKPVVVKTNRIRKD